MAATLGRGLESDGFVADTFPLCWLHADSTSATTAKQQSNPGVDFGRFIGAPLHDPDCGWVAALVMLLNTMRTKRSVASQPRRVFCEWYREATLGHNLRAIEASYLLDALQLTYNETVLQVGFLGAETNYVPNEFRSQFSLIALPEDSDYPRDYTISALAHDLPIASASIDVLILPHVLEFEADPHQSLREAERILKPEGRLFVIGFNPWSVRGIVQYLPRRETFWRWDFISHYRLMDWLSLLKLEAEYQAAFGAAAARIITRPQTFARRTKACISFAYAIKAIKRTYSVIPIRPAWVAAPVMVPGPVLETSLAHDQPRP